MTLIEKEVQVQELNGLEVQSENSELYSETKKRGRKPRIKEKETTATFIISNERKGMLYNIIYMNNCKSLTNFINEALDYYVSSKFPDSKEAFLKTNLQ